MTKNRRLWFLAGLFILLLAWGVNDSNSFKLVDNGNQNWKTIKLTSEKLSLQTPPQWSISEDETESNKPPQNIVLLSPTINGYFFSLEVSSGSSQDVYPDFLGVGQAKNLTNLNTANAPTSLYVAAKLSGENQDVDGISLASSSGDKTVFGIPDKDANGKNNITMSAVLHSTVPSSTPVAYSLSFYQSQPEYKNLIKIFKTVSFAP
jgi:hypothetical protein